MYEFVKQDDEDVTGWLPGHYYKFYASFIYDDVPGGGSYQESTLVRINGVGDFQTLPRD